MATAPVAVLLSGCVSTQTVAARARLADARILASQSRTEVAAANPAVAVGPPAVIHDRAGTAIVVSLRNESARALTDLPISVGVSIRSGREVYLNDSANLDYFQSHVAAIGPAGATAWVFTTGPRIPPGRLLVTVGAARIHPTLSRSLPSVGVSLQAVRSVRGAIALTVSIVNHSAIPQYDLPVYALALRGGREVAAGETTVAHLGSHGRATSNVSLLGSSRYGSLQLIATPTIFN